MFQKKVAFLAAVILTAILLSPVFAQETHPAKVVTSGQNAGMTFEPAPTPEAATPQAPVQSVTHPAWETRPGVEEATRRVLTGQFQGQRGPRGFRGRPGRDARQGHKAPYQHIKSWGVVDGRVARGVSEAKGYADGLLAGHTQSGHRDSAGEAPAGTADKPDTPDAQERDWGWLWWLLLVLLVLAILAGIGYLLWRYLRRPKPAPKPADVTNTGSGEAFGENLPRSTFEVEYDGVAVAIKKGYLDGAPGPKNPFKLVEEDQTVRIKSKKGQLHRFILLAENKDVFPMPTDTVWMRDKLACQIPHEVEYAGIFVGNQELRKLRDDEKMLLTSGERFSLKRWIDKIPVGEVVAFIYDVRCTSGKATIEGIPTSDLGQSPLPLEPGSEFRLEEILAARQTKAEAEAKQEAEEAARKAEADRKTAEAEAAVKVKPRPRTVVPKAKDVVKPPIVTKPEAGLAATAQPKAGPASAPADPTVKKDAGPAGKESPGEQTGRKIPSFAK